MPNHDNTTIESDALAAMVGRAQELILADICGLADRLETNRTLAGLTVHDANLVAEPVAWAVARTPEPVKYLRGAAYDAEVGIVRFDDPARATAALLAAADTL